MITGASLEPIPSSRQRSHSGVFCSKRSILGIVIISLGLFGALTIEQLDRAPIAAFAHLLQRVDLVVGQHSIEFGLGLVDQQAKLAGLLGSDQSLGAVARCVIDSLVFRIIAG